MYNFDYGYRFDQFDYERFGLSRRWYFRDTVVLLTDFEMETKGYYQSQDYMSIYSKIYDKYMDYLSACMWSKKFKYIDGISEEHLAYIPEDTAISFDINWANFTQDDFLTYLATDPKIKLNIDKLKRFLSGDEVPCLKVQSGQQVDSENNLKTCSEDEIDEVDEPSTDIKSEEGTNRSSGSTYKYRFEETDKGWYIQFEDVSLPGVKNLLGMQYIKVLLQNPGQKIDVVKLQQLVGCREFQDIDSGAEYGKYKDVDDNVNLWDRSSGWEMSDRKAVEAYIERIQKINVLIDDARKNHDGSEIGKLIGEKDALEKMIKEATFRPKDPELEKNRKRVHKSIKDTIKAIRKLEEICNYHDKPISGHLSRYIKTGASCSYAPQDDHIPSWTF
ncbi:MAG: hypothetical protein VB050_16715 [Geobacteraceae bacterium]|nr:hypothetical protein [Geobacteraceae bacterium]